MLYAEYDYAALPTVPEHAHVAAAEVKAEDPGAFDQLMGERELVVELMDRGFGGGGAGAGGSQDTKRRKR